MTDGTTPYVRPDVAAFLAFLNAQEGPKMEEMPPEAGRVLAFGVSWGAKDDTSGGVIARAEGRNEERLGGRVDAIFYCPHAADSKCDCRKPKPGMFRR